MKNEIIIAGSCGQGVLLAGVIITQTAIEQNLHTTWFPSYGAEVRGGTANSTTIISNEEIGSPIASNPDVLVVLNELSLNKFMPTAKEDAVIIANSSLISSNIQCNPKTYFVALNDIADLEIKNIKSANMVAIGALLKILEKKHQDKTCVLTLENAFKACRKIFSQKSNLIESNRKALQAGYNFIV
ncbi:MAG: 2-oxoacid:acceptor oxidoreductase family protein [Elusimicrobiota bacterium]|jgi:2-oxoglutarate ferredoxin oxidoreductase subunit gamma|nr:2-oxoacid:acceptor oxidoreductase family protein [Elusimicrobiota bacterium]